MKFVLSTIIFLSFSFNLFSQAEKTKTRLSFVVGPAIAIGNFGKKDVSSRYAGFAGIGQHITISYQMMMTKKFGFCAALHGQRNPLATKDLEEGYARTDFGQGVWFGPWPPAPSPTPIYYPDWKFEKRTWKTASLLVGGFTVFPSRSEKISFMAKGLIGLVYAAAPGLEGNSITDTATAHVRQEKGTAWGFGFSLGAGLHYELTSSIYLSASLDLLGTNNFRFRDISTTIITTKGRPGSPEYSVQQTVRTFDRSQNISSINAGIGMGIRL